MRRGSLKKSDAAGAGTGTGPSRDTTSGLVRRSIGQVTKQGQAVPPEARRRSMEKNVDGHLPGPGPSVSTMSFYGIDDESEEQEEEEEGPQGQVQRKRKKQQRVVKKAPVRQCEQKGRRDAILATMNHPLKARDEDLRYLRRRVLYSGIFEQESSDEDDRPKRTRRKTFPCFKGTPPPEIPIPEFCGSGLSIRSSPFNIPPPLPPCPPTPPEVELWYPVKPWERNICEDNVGREEDSRVSVMSSGIEDEWTSNGSMVAGSDISLGEKLCLLEVKGKEAQALSMKERYMGSKTIPGYAQYKCIDKTVENLRCLPPGELVKRAIDTYKLWAIPSHKPLSREEFIRLMSCLENHPNNDYICLVYALPFLHPEFSPYFLKIVKYNEVGNRIHFTASRYGILSIAHGMAEYTSMTLLMSRMRVYDRLRRIRFFKNYPIWKAFHIWRNKIRVAKWKKVKGGIVDRLVAVKRPFRIAILELAKMCAKLTRMSLLKIRHGEAHSLEEFMQSQLKHLEDVGQRFKAFDGMVVEMTGAACRTALIEEGFSPDKYPEEMEFYMRQLEVPVHQLNDKLHKMGTLLDYPGQWLPFSQQRKKKKVCRRITDFIRLVDYMVQRAYHKLLKTSLFILMLEMQARLPFTPEQYFERFEDMETYRKIIYKINLHDGMPEISGNTDPMFDIGCSWNDDGLIFSPSMIEYVKGFRAILGAWRGQVLSYKNLLTQSVFDPYTMPIINGYFEERTCGEGPNFSFLLDLDPLLESMELVIEKIIRHTFKVSDKYIKAFDSIRIFCLENEKLDLEILRNETDVEKFRAWLEKFAAQNAILEQLEDLKGMGVFRVNNSILRAYANPTIERCIEVLHETMPFVGKEKVQDCTERMQAAIDKLNKYPQTADEYVDYLMYLEQIMEEMEEIEKDLDITAELYDLMEDYKVPCEDTDLKNFVNLTPMLTQLRDIIDETTENKDKILDELLEQFRVESEEIFKRMARLRKIVEAPDVLDPKSKPEKLLKKLQEAKDTLLADQEKANKFTNYQKKLKVDVTDFEELEKLITFTKIRYQLWDSISRWDVQAVEWNAMAFKSIDPDKMQKDVNDYVKSIQQLEKGLPPNPVVPILKEKVEHMRAQLNWIANLHNPNIRKRHWDVLENQLGIKLTNPTTTLKELMDQGISEFAEVIQEMSAQASSEQSLEALLKKVEDSWQEVEFVVLNHKDQRDVFILGGTDDIQALLDDSLIHMTTISSSRHVGPIKPKVDEWMKMLDLFATTLEEWTNCQRSWIHLESVFAAPDIQRQLPNEARMFAQVDKSWREIMGRTNRNPLALRAGTMPGLLEAFLTNNELLEQIMKCLDDYLESKRVVFPRFYFLSNEELLEILAQTRNPAAVQPHMRKCFDAIQKLEFGGPQSATALDILAMFSPEDERVSLTKGLKTRGNVEEWLGRVEDAMFNSLKRITRNCLADYHQMAREEWVQRFPSQCVLSISQLMWAQVVHMILDGPGNSISGMKEFEKKNFENLGNLAAMVRGQLTSLVRAVLCALITIDVHARDIITALVQKKVTTSGNFEWLKQLRYYWNSEEEIVIAKMANAQYNYGYEYLGASPRLVITPLTDRCYLCLMGALQLDLGGAPAGPAGTGKTETTKDLAKSLAFMCVVFNCSEGLDYKMMGKFFSGLAQSGGWCCFDEFNRIDIEVLSVIAQQLRTIQLAKLQHLTRFMFEGREIKLVRTCAAFITMNPGYAGRTELPDNLKSLFRPISMMVPDYTLIAEVILYSEGFESSKTLAFKMTQMYKLCSEQLSQQDHYDFGMRAVKSVLVMAGSLKRSNPDINENIVLIRALRDSNLPKFLAHDAVLLQGIIQDLFPGVVIPEQDYGILQKQSVWCALEKGLQAPEPFIRKVIQFFETLVVRHGVMLVGPTGGGKTSIYNVLKEALTQLCENRVDNYYYKPVDTYVLNPKAVSIGELYGEVNPLTFEWHDGLLGIMVRNSVKPKNTYHQWIVCDGPVDAIWIENMNTVLDDNKMLCLANSERIKLTVWVRMMFEVQDLSQASPATVSRCGMVYVDPNEMGWMPFVQSWMQKYMAEPEHEPVKNYLFQLFEKYIASGFTFIKKNCSEVMPQSEMGKIQMMCAILQAFLKKPSFLFDLPKPELMKQTALVFTFAYIWSVGSNLQEKSHQTFDTFVREQLAKEEYCKLPKSGFLWGYYNNLESKKFENWESIMPSYIYNPAIPFVDILVPTMDTVRFGFLMELLLSVNKAVLFTGPTGTGKSAIAKYVLTTIAGPNSYLPVFMNFSAQTTSKRTQEMIEEKLEKRKKSLLSAPAGKKVIVFIDDLNMPKLDRYGAQPSLELLRQLLDFNGCYDRQKMYWRELQNVILSAACAPPGGGRNAVTPRLLRHFCMMAIPTPAETVLNNIYKAILRGFTKDFDIEIRDIADVIVTAGIETYQYMAKTFLPTPSKSHYLFNMRDLSKCIQGILQAKKEVVVRKGHMIRLFYHEVLRVFHDRLTNDDDRNLFCNSLVAIVTNHFKPAEPIKLNEYRNLIYGDFMKMGTSREDRVYDEILNKDKLKHVLADYLDEYNVESTRGMDLVFFMDAAEQVARIARILRTDRGNALLVGVGGMGKQSLTRLASYISGYRCFQIELMRGYDYTSFHEDLKKLYDCAGMRNEPITFLFTDTQIAYEEFLEDINNVLNSGEVPNLLEPEDLERMLAPIRNDTKKLGIPEGDRDAIYDCFIRRIRSNLHIVLCMSPVGDSFRIRCRMFPSLVNCCTIDWFNEWPTEALLSVATTLIAKIQLIKGVTPESMAQVSVFIHESVTKMAVRFYDEMRRRFYTTPSSYLELINLYSIMLKEQRDKIAQGKARIINGLKKLLETNDIVKQMRIELKDMEPLLQRKNEAVEEFMLRIGKDQALADKVRKTVAAEEEIAKVKAIETQVIADEAQEDLKDVMPVLEEAVKSLNQLNKEDINETKSYQKPPELVRVVMESVCILFNKKPDWNESRLLLSDANFLRKLYEYDKDNIKDDQLKKLKTYVENPKFNAKAVEKVSLACRSICLWARAMFAYGNVYKQAEPKIKRYKAANEALEKVIAFVKQKQEELAAVERKVQKLQQQFLQIQKEKMDLEETLDVIAQRLNRAGRLTKALASEQIRWTESVENFDKGMDNLIGDVYIGSACIAYYGAFTSDYRNELVDSWTTKCIAAGLPCTPGFTLMSLVDIFEVRVWNSHGLPKDNTSTENAILATRGRRWPLMIDPQDQANRWVKQNEIERGLKVLKMSDPTLMRTLETCIRMGYPCLLEEVKETLEPALEPILLKQVFMQNGREVIRLGDSNVDYDRDFRLFMTSKMSNPHYLPEVCIKVTIINFTVTFSGLEEQLLSEVVAVERPDLESQRMGLVNQINGDKNMLIELESKTLRMLQASEGNILDDEELIDTLNQSKITSVEIVKRVAQAEITEKTISFEREKYRPVASRGSVLYFVVAQLAELDPMYQYSLKFFTQVFNFCIGSVTKEEELEERLQTLRKETTVATYTNISRGLFEKDKLIFSFMLCADVLKSLQKITDAEWNFFLRGATGEQKAKPKKPLEFYWLTVHQWNNALDLEANFEEFRNLTQAAMSEMVRIRIGGFKTVLFERSEKDAASVRVNDSYDKRLTNFQKVLLIKCCAQEKLIATVTEFVKVELGQKFIESPATDLAEVFKDLNKTTSLVFVLSQGSDPMPGFFRFAFAQEMGDRVSSISLGQGQGPIAETMIRNAIETGDWVFLQNCHLASSWLPKMEVLVKQINENPDTVVDSFRLFMSSMPTTTFPVSVLQESVKITNEPPKGLRANVRGALLGMEKEFFEENVLGQDWRRIIFGVCFFHAVIQERKKFGPLGWNIKYEFNDSDRECALLNFDMFCKGGVIPWDALEYITALITYGGRVTDSWDQRCLTTILKIFFSRPTLDPAHKFSPSGLYYAPRFKQVGQYVEYVDALPVIDEPEIFGMHSNATITFQRNESTAFIDALLTAQPKQSGGSAATHSDEICYDIAEDLENKLPEKLDLDKASRYLFELQKGRIASTTIFITQEIERFNRLLNLIRDTLSQLKKGIRGLVVIDEDLEKMYHAFLDNRVPDLWKPKSYGSLKSLGSWFKDFQLRFNFIRNWIYKPKPPKSYWLSGFFFQQGFLTAVLQTFSRKYSLPIDQLKFHYVVLPIVKEELMEPDLNIENSMTSPDDGVLIHGLFLEAARWDKKKNTLADELPGEMTPLLPVTHFVPSMNAQPTKNIYNTPMYKTSIRAGVLSTTGHSTNFIVPIQLPSVDQEEDYWIMRGTALLSQLTD